MKKIFLTLLAVLSILAFITACGDSTGGNPLIQPENGTGDNSTETNPTDTPSTGGGIAKSLKDRITEAKAGDIIDLGVEKLSITEGESYTISKAITIKNGDAKDGTFTVETTGAKLLNLRNINSIIADEKIQDGDLNIINCYEIDSIYVNGGGANSIHISSTTVTNLFVQKENVRVVLEAATSNEEGSNAEGQSKTATVKNVQIKTDCKLDSTDEKATFKNVQISYDVEKLILSGSANVDKILAESDETATVEIESEDVKIEKTTENVELTTPENSQIQIPSVDKIDTYYTVTVLAYPFTQGSMKLPEGFLFSFEEMIFKDAELEGWYLDSLFTQKATFPHVVNSDVTFYAKFILDKQCKIVFSGNIFVDELTFNYGQIIQESDIPDLTEEVKEYGYIWEGWYLDYETTQPLTFPFIITHDIRVYPKVSQMEGNTGNGETPDDTGNSGNSGTGNSGETDDDDSIISEIDFSIPVTSQEDFEFTVGTWLCEQTSKQGSLDSIIQTTTTKLVFTITETLPTSSIQAIAEKYETIATYPSQYFSSYEQAKQQYPTSMPEYEFTFDDANLTITMVASKESLNEISAGYSAITYEQFVSGYLTFGDTIENVTNSEKTILKSINNPDSNIKIETIFVKIADDNSGNSGTGNSGETDDDDSIISEVDFSIPVTSQEDFEFTVGTWLCEQTLQAGNPAEMLQTTNSKIIFTITETSPTATIQAIVEKYEMIITYGSEFSSSYEQAKKQYPSSVPEYEFSFDDKNLTITAIASKEALDESSTIYNGLTYEEFVSGYLTFVDTIENFANSEKTILKSINNPDSNTKIETIFVKISESK